MSKLTPSQRNDVARRYTAGESGYALSREYGIVRRSVYQLLETRGVAKRVAAQTMKDKTFITPDFVRRAVELYDTTKSSGATARAMGCSAAPVLKALHSAGVDVPDQYTGRSRAARALVPCNDSAFQTLTPDVLYWIGFLWADGHVARNRIVLGLASRDRGQVEAFRAFCGRPDGRIADYTDSNGHKHSTFAMYSRSAAYRLETLGFTGTKKDRVPPPDLASSLHFWRGVIDGDGTVGVYCARGRPSERVSLVGGHGTVNSFLGYVRSVTGDHTSHAGDCGNYAQTQFNGKRAYDLMAILYGNGGPSLARKMEHATAILRDRADVPRQWWKGRKDSYMRRVA